MRSSNSALTSELAESIALRKEKEEHAFILNNDGADGRRGISFCPVFALFRHCVYRPVQRKSRNPQRKNAALALRSGSWTAHWSELLLAADDSVQLITAAAGIPYLSSGGAFPQSRFSMP